MSTLDQLIEVQISTQTTPIGVASFSNILVFGKNPTFPERIRFFTVEELTALAGLLTGGTSSPEYKAVSAIFAQNNHPNTVAVGRQGSAETEVVALQEIQAESNDWYAIVYPAHDDTKADEIAAWALTAKKVFAYASNEAVMYSAPAGDTTSIAAQLKATANSRAMAIYSADADNSFPDASIFSVLLPKEAGTYTAAYKTLAGVPVDKLSGTNSKAIHDKNASTYEEIGGRNVFLFGQLGSGDYLDLTIFVDVLKARIQEEIYRILVSQDKVSFDDVGIAQIEQGVRVVLSRFQNTGAITKDSFDQETKVRTGGYEVTVPSAASVSLNDKANRYLQGVKFTLFYSGAIHTIKLNGVVKE